jgi:hypothetical protein
VLAGANHGAVDVGELARVLGQRPCKGRPGIDFGAQHGHQVALAFVVGLFGKRRQRALQREAGGDQPRHLSRPDRKPCAAKHRPLQPAASGARAVCRLRLRGGRDRERNQRLRPQLTACGLGVVGFQHASACLALGVKGFKDKGGHRRYEKLASAAMVAAAHWLAAAAQSTMDRKPRRLVRGRKEFPC